MVAFVGLTIFRHHSCGTKWSKFWLLMLLNDFLVPFFRLDWVGSKVFGTVLNHLVRDVRTIPAKNRYCSIMENGLEL